ncbi:MAG: lactonase family protein [Bacteroidota bacterium]|nr:lactonase family protein [Bacteroidota bacterium]
MKKKFQLIALVLASAALTFSSCKKEEQNLASQQSATGTPDFSEKGANPDDADLSPDALARHTHNNYVYTESNDAGTNHILVYKKNANGSLTYQSSEASGGAGTGALFGSQGALVLDKHHEWLYAVNAGDNSVSSFKVHNNGDVTLKHTEGSGGTLPVSLCVYNDLLYVVNQTSANIKGIRIGAGGSLTGIPSSIKVLSAPNADPGQISFRPNGNQIYITERGTDKITSFHINGQGVAHNRTVNASAGVTPFGFDFARNYLVVANAHMDLPNLGGVASYSLNNSGSVNDVNGNVDNNQTAACWTATTRYGRFAYIANSFSDNISSYYIGFNGAAYLINGAAAATGARPRDLTIVDNYYVYVLNVTDHTIGEYRRGFLGSLHSIGQVSNVPVWAAGLASY